MKLQLEFNAPQLSPSIRYNDKIMLLGSCFSTHISDRLAQYRFDICSNPNGIIYSPNSIARGLNDYLAGKTYKQEELFLLHELWNSWTHHSVFSDTDATAALDKMNKEQQLASCFILEADWVILSLGTAFQYSLIQSAEEVVNNHRAPNDWFQKTLLSVNEMFQKLLDTLTVLHLKNPAAKVIFTISPIRHIRDGVVENNISKARLIELVHQLCSAFSWVYYFPAYELVIDVLRDYRFYDVDMVHPNQLAINFVWEQFQNSCIDKDDWTLMKKVHEIYTAKQHRPRFKNTLAYRDFCQQFAEKAKQLQLECPFINLVEEIRYFEEGAREE